MRATHSWVELPIGTAKHKRCNEPVAENMKNLPLRVDGALPQLSRGDGLATSLGAAPRVWPAFTCVNVVGGTESRLFFHSVGHEAIMESGHPSQSLPVGRVRVLNKG